MSNEITCTIPEPRDHQLELINSTSFRRAIIAGVGGGKTLAGVELAFKAACEQPQVRGALVNATYTLLRDTTLDEWFQRIPPEAYTWKPSEQRIYMHNGAIIYCRGADQPQKRIAGWNLGWCVYDEAGLAKDDKVVKMLTQRIRKGDPSKRFIALVSSPRGYEWLKDWCERPDTHLIRATTYDNPFTGKRYIEEMEKDFPPGTQDHAQEMLGEFIHRTGLLYGEYFVPSRHIIPVIYEPSRHYDLGWDPGKRASAQVAIQACRGGHAVVKEWLPNEPTEDTIVRIQRDMGKPPRRVYIDTPSSNNSRTTYNDMELMHQAWGRATEVLVSGGIHRRTDYREECVRSALGREKVFFSSNLLRQSGTDNRGMIRAIQTMPYLSDRSRDEKRDDKDERLHVIDALEFALVYLCPPRFYDSSKRRKQMQSMAA